MPMQQNPNNRRRGEERNETLIIPHITKEMVETARRMAERGASRAEIEQAIAAMQAGKTPTEAESAAQKKPIVQPQAAAAPARNTAAHSDTVIIPTSRPRYTSARPSARPSGRSSHGRRKAISAPTATGSTAQTHRRARRNPL